MCDLAAAYALRCAHVAAHHEAVAPMQVSAMSVGSHPFEMDIIDLRDGTYKCTGVPRVVGGWLDVVKYVKPALSSAQPKPQTHQILGPSLAI